MDENKWDIGQHRKRRERESQHPVLVLSNFDPLSIEINYD